MLHLEKRRSVDLLVEQFWKNGFLTLRRRFGTYLPEPEKIGSFDIDIIAHQKGNYAIGITLVDDDFKDSNILEKINYLADRQTKSSNKKVMLYIGVPFEHYKKAKKILEFIQPELQKNIRLFQITERRLPALRRRKRDERNLFS